MSRHFKPCKWKWSIRCFLQPVQDNWFHMWNSNALIRNEKNETKWNNNWSETEQCRNTVPQSTIELLNDYSVKTEHTHKPSLIPTEAYSTYNGGVHFLAIHLTTNNTTNHQIFALYKFHAKNFKMRNFCMTRLQKYFTTLICGWFQNCLRDLRLP